MSKFLSIFSALLLAITLACSGGGSSSGGTQNPHAPAGIAPSIVTQPQSLTVTAGQEASFTVVGTGTAPLSYRWRKGTVTVGTDSPTFTLTGVLDSDAGNYTVSISNSAGSITSTTAILTVTPAVVAPSITSQPQSLSVTVGQDATFSVVATGTAPLSYQWKKGATSIGTDSSTLSLTSVQTSDADDYTVTITNNVDSITSDVATLTVTQTAVAPAITAQPQSQTVTAGQNASFTVAATGTAPLSYQWKKGSTNVGTNSSTFTLNNIQASDAGAYTVVVSNTAGDATSNAATLTVNPTPLKPTITSFSASPTSISAGGTSTLSWSVTNATSVSINQGIGAVNASDQVDVTPSATTTYTLTASNGAGDSTAQATVSISPGTSSGWLYTKTGGNKIYVDNGSGETVWMGRGVNMDDLFLGGYNSSLWMTTAEAEQALMDSVSTMMSDWKPNFLRVVMGLNSYDSTVSWLTGTAQYREPMERVIQALGAYPNTYVLMNLRSDTSMTGCDKTDDATCVPTTTTDALYEAWVDAFYDKPYVMFGLSNEPGGMDLSYTELRSTMSHAVDVIRAREDSHSAQHHIIVVQGDNWTSNISFYGTTPLTQDNIVYEYHSYPPEITGTYGYTYSNIPVIIGEYGGGNYAPFTQTEIDTFFPDWETKQIPNLAWYFSPFSAVAPALLNTTHDGTSLQPTAWGTIVRTYLRNHAQ